MQKLNFPEYRFDFKKQEGKVMIFDIIRKKYVVLTPEEWVRQHLVSYLIHEKGFSRGLIRIETGLNYNERKKRADLVIYNRLGVPFLLAECKSSQINLNEETIFQLGIYQKTLQAKYLVVSNGQEHLCWQRRNPNEDFKLIDEIPSMEEIT